MRGIIDSSKCNPDTCDEITTRAMTDEITTNNTCDDIRTRVMTSQHVGGDNF